MQLAIDQIPEELKLLKRWVVWKYETRGDKRSKVPYTVNGFKARVDDPATWAEFDQAVARVADFHGIGFVVTAAEKMTVWDLDHCLNPKTVEIVDPKVKWAVETLGSYTEITPSGEGLRILMKGTLPLGRNRRGHYEGYSVDRYVTITGHRFPGTVGEIRENQKGIDAVFSRLLKAEITKLDLALADAKVKELWNSTEADWERLGLSSHSEADLALCRRLAAFGTDDEVDAWFRQSGLMREKWDRVDYRTKTLLLARAQAVAQVNARATDLAHAQRFTRIADGEARFSSSNDWYSWNGRWYERARLDHLQAIGKRVVMEIHDEAMASRDLTDRARLLKEMIGLESLKQFSAMLNFAKAETFTLSSEFNRDRSLFNCATGTLELSKDPKRLITCREHRKEDLLTQGSTVAYDAGATCPKWDAFVAQVTAPHPDLARFLQTLAGYSLSGWTDEQRLFYLYGAGANGKTTFMNVISRIMGDYAAPLDQSTLLASKQDPHPTGLADLQGLHMAVVAELPERRTINETLVKSITGGEAIKARRMHGNFYTFESHAKLWVYGNYQIRIRGVNEAIWRRMTMIPFEAQIPEAEQIKDYWETLLAEEASGILNWMLKGFLTWRDEGLHLPASVKAATEDYRKHENLAAAFLDEELEIDASGAGTYTDEVYADWVLWCRDRGEEPGTARGFTDKLRAAGIPTVVGAANKRKFQGVRLRRKGGGL